VRDATFQTALRLSRLVYLTWTTLFISEGRHLKGRGNNLENARVRPKPSAPTEIIT